MHRPQNRIPSESHNVASVTIGEHSTPKPWMNGASLQIGIPSPQHNPFAFCSGTVFQHILLSNLIAGTQLLNIKIPFL